MGLLRDTGDPADLATLGSAGASRSLPGRRELIWKKPLAMRGKIATRYTKESSDGFSLDFSYRRVSDFPGELLKHSPGRFEAHPQRCFQRDICLDHLTDPHSRSPKSKSATSRRAERSIFAYIPVARVVR